MTTHSCGAKFLMRHFLPKNAFTKVASPPNDNSVKTYIKNCFMTLTCSEFKIQFNCMMVLCSMILKTISNTHSFICHSFLIGGI